jgi:hypothetical protein
MAKRSWVRRVLGAGAIAGAAYAVWRAIEANRPAGDTDWEPQPFPFPPQPRTADVATTVPPASPAPSPAAPAVPPSTAAPKAASEPWIDATAGTCPTSHPVKVARASKVFHVPGGQMYDRTTADRCYRDPAAAEADGLRQSKR